LVLCFGFNIRRTTVSLTPRRLANPTPDLSQHMRQSPPLKAVSNGEFESMDGYQWALAAGAHTERHAKQILEIKADPNFPAR
jgi:hypothetical protein